MKLFPYQVVGVEFLCSRRRACLFDDQGLGKSAQAITACKVLSLKRVLIVCPASLRINWEKEWVKFGPKNVTPTIVSYNFIRNISKVKATWDVVIADESQALAKWTAKQTQVFVLTIAPKARRIWLMSASPAVKTAADYHPQLSLMLPGQLGTFKEFKDRHCFERMVGRGRYRRVEISGFKDEERINKLIKKVALRRLREDVLKELPKKRFSTFYVNTPEVDISYEDMLASMEEGDPIPSIIPPLRQLGLDKAHECVDWLREFREPVVIWTWFRDTAEYLGQALKNKRVAFVTGRETAKRKQFATEQMQSGKLDFLIANIAAGGTGHTWTKASTCVFIELPFSPAMYEQAWSRIYRIGQSRGVNIINVLSENSLDERILSILRRKSTGMKKCLE